MITYPNCLEGSRLLAHFSISLRATSNLGLMTPHLLSRPLRKTTIFPALWSSTISNSPMYPVQRYIKLSINAHQLMHFLHTTATVPNKRGYHSPCFIITVRNLTITLEQGLMSTCRLPRFSALHIDTKASFNTLMRTMAAKEEYSMTVCQKAKLVSMPKRTGLDRILLYSSILLPYSAMRTYYLRCTCERTIYRACAKHATPQ